MRESSQQRNGRTQRAFELKLAARKGSKQRRPTTLDLSRGFVSRTSSSEEAPPAGESVTAADARRDPQDAREEERTAARCTSPNSSLI